jgi:hypothetical protein
MTDWNLSTMLVVVMLVGSWFQFLMVPGKQYYNQTMHLTNERVMSPPLARCPCRPNNLHTRDRLFGLSVHGTRDRLWGIKVEWQFKTVPFFFYFDLTECRYHVLNLILKIIDQHDVKLARRYRFTRYHTLAIIYINIHNCLYYIYHHYCEYQTYSRMEFRTYR